MKTKLVALSASSLTALALFAGLAAAAPATPACQAVLKAKVMLNTAPATQLECLPGVGKTVAADLIKERPFKSERDFLNRIEGGRKLWTAISPYVVLK